MRVSLQVRLLLMCVVLVVLASGGLSVTYYTLTKQEKHRESQERIQIAFDIVLADFAERTTSYSSKLDDFLQGDSAFAVTASSYMNKKARINSGSFISNYLIPVADKLKNFGETVSIAQLALYAIDTRLLAVYQRHEEQEESLGVFVVSEAGNDSYLTVGDPSQRMLMAMGQKGIADTPLLPGVSAYFEGDIPDTLAVYPFSKGQSFGIRIAAPIYYEEEKTGLLVADLLYTQKLVEHFASLSKTAMNLFAENRFSAGTLPAQAQFEAHAMRQSVTCEELLNGDIGLDITSARIGNHAYYQGNCVFKGPDNDDVGAISVSLSQDIEKQGLQKILIAMLVTSGITIVIASGLILLFSHNTTRLLQQFIRYIDHIAQGRIPEKIVGTYQGEFHDIVHNVNMLIDTMNGLLTEVDATILAIGEGQLDFRGHAESFEGEWRQLILGINAIIDGFVTPITVTAASIGQIAKGELPKKITDEYKGDFDQVKQHVNLLIEAMSEITRIAERIAAGKLGIKVEERSEHDVIMRALNTMISKLNAVVIQVQSAVDDVSTISQTLHVNSEKMSKGAAQQVAATEETSASMEEMIANIRQSSNNAAQTEKIAFQSAEYAKESSTVMAETVTTMQTIAQKISIVQEIAGETRLLSLNATIEAARAEEHGKAFSVIAAEVRNLSNIAKKAAEEIDESTGFSVEVAEKAEMMLEKLLPNIEKTAALVQEISAASREQSTGSAHINGAIQQLDQVAQQNAVISETIAAAAAKLATQAEELQSIVQFFQLIE
ncbi:MAG: methyl-accepting chemotaxis protein [bacterium]|nr:methyl-accepting chemotaxis protein [bacterium]